MWAHGATRFSLARVPGSIPFAHWAIPPEVPSNAPVSPGTRATTGGGHRVIAWVGAIALWMLLAMIATAAAIATWGLVAPRYVRPAVLCALLLIRCAALRWWRG